MVYGALFFGVPNDGLDVASLIPMVGDGPNRFFLESLGHLNSRNLREQHKSFLEAFNFKGSSEIYSFYETRQSPKAKQVHGPSDHINISWY